MSIMIVMTCKGASTGGLALAIEIALCCHSSPVEVFQCAFLDACYVQLADVADQRRGILCCRQCGAMILHTINGIRNESNGHICSSQIEFRRASSFNVLINAVVDLQNIWHGNKASVTCQSWERCSF